MYEQRPHNGSPATHTFQDELITLAGGTNETPSPKGTAGESLLITDQDVIILDSGAGMGGIKAKTL